VIYVASKLFRMELDRKAIGKRIAKARRSRTPGRGWSQKDLAEAIGLSLHTIRGWENGLRLPRSVVLGTLATCLRRSLDWLLLGRGRNARHWKG